MLVEFLQEAAVVDDRDIAVKLGSAMLCGTVTALLGNYLVPALGSQFSIFTAAAVGYLAGTALMRRLKRKEHG